MYSYFQGKVLSNHSTFSLHGIYLNRIYKKNKSLNAMPFVSDIIPLAYFLLFLPAYCLFYLEVIIPARWVP